MISLSFRKERKMKKLLMVIAGVITQRGLSPYELG